MLRFSPSVGFCACLAVGLALLVASPPAAAQTFDVVDAAPAPGATSVPLEATVRLTFDAPIDTTARFGDDGALAFYAIEPADSIEVHAVRFEAGLTEVAFDVTHREDTDYVWVLTGARSSAGASLCRPFVLHYTTADEAGPLLLRGHAEIMIVLLPRADCQRGLVAALLDAEPGEGASVVAASTLDEAFGFEIDGVRAGTYWPVLFFDWDRDGVVEPEWSRIGDVESEVGLHDSDDDGRPDPIVVSDTSTVEIQLNIVGMSIDGSGESIGAARELWVYPMPAGGNVFVGFELSRPAPVAIRVYDLLGRRRAEVARGYFAAGAHEIGWQAGALPAGTYLVRVEGADFALTRPLVRVR